MWSLRMIQQSFPKPTEVHPEKH
uniref:Uncharacterized protein n=1 Tax=Anguilla anguilla TaxID=7936 RepID=A0A0E9PJV0_ANGAN